ncbi:hypothetical protein ACT4UL_26190, partial [Bacillus sp. HC-TM]
MSKCHDFYDITINTALSISFIDNDLSIMNDDKTRTVHIIVLLSSSTMISACSQQLLEAEKSKPLTSSTNIQMMEGPTNKKEIESFA